MCLTPENVYMDNVNDLKMTHAWLSCISWTKCNVIVVAPVSGLKCIEETRDIHDGVLFAIQRTWGACGLLGDGIYWLIPG